MPAFVIEWKVRLSPYKHYKPGERKKDFIRIFGYIMEGRNIEQKANLSRKIIERINHYFPIFLFY